MNVRTIALANADLELLNEVDIEQDGLLDRVVERLNDENETHYLGMTSDDLRILEGTR